MNDELKERVKALAVEAGGDAPGAEPWWAITDDELLAFAQAVARDCVKLCDERASLGHAQRLSSEGWSVAETNAFSCAADGDAAAIRARYGLGD